MHDGVKKWKRKNVLLQMIILLVLYVEKYKLPEIKHYINLSREEMIN